MRPRPLTLALSLAAAAGSGASPATGDLVEERTDRELRGALAAAEAAARGGAADDVRPYRPLSATARAAQRALLPRLLAAARGDLDGDPAAAPLAALAAEASEAGARLSLHRDGDRRLALLALPPGRGEPLLVVRLGRARPLLIQAPHARGDLWTGPVARALFDAVDARALALATAPRRRVDLAHRPDTLLQAWTLGWADAGAGAVVQLHGFEPGRRRAASARGAAAILSLGDLAAAPAATALRAELAEALDGPVPLFGVDVDELGGTRNAQAAALAPAGAPFLHLELSPASRRALAPAARPTRRLAAALARWLQAPTRSRPGGP